MISVGLEQPDPPPISTKHEVPAMLMEWWGSHIQEVGHVDKCFWMLTLVLPSVMLTATQQSLNTTWLECLNDDVYSFPEWLKMRKEDHIESGASQVRWLKPEWGEDPGLNSAQSNC